MSRFAAATAAAAACLMQVIAGPAAADPGQPPAPTPGEAAACEQAWTPLQDPRVGVVNPRLAFGSLMYDGWVRQHCGGPDATFPNGAAVAGSGLEPEVPAWQKLPPAGPAPTAGQ